MPYLHFSERKCVDPQPPKSKQALHKKVKKGENVMIKNLANCVNLKLGWEGLPLYLWGGDGGGKLLL